MKPFNLQEALAGKKVVNGCGDSVVVTKLAVDPSNGLCLLSQQANSGSIVAYHYRDGRSLGGSNDYCLFMAPEKKEAWVNLYKVARYGQGLGEATAFATEELANLCHARSGLTRLGGKAFRIEYEE